MRENDKGERRQRLMQEEYCNLKRLLRRRKERLARAQSLSSPGFGEVGGGGGDTCAPYESDILTAADLEGEIDQAMLAFVNAVEDENMAILSENCGRQRQCVLRLKSIAGKSLWEIADILDVSIKTVKNRLNDTGEECVQNEGRLILTEEIVERHIARIYQTLSSEIGTEYFEVNGLIEAHLALAESRHREYEKLTASARNALSHLTGTTRAVVEARMTGVTWDKVGRAAGCTPRHARRLYRSFFETNL